MPRIDTARGLVTAQFPPRDRPAFCDGCSQEAPAASLVDGEEPDANYFIIGAFEFELQADVAVW